MEIKYSQLKVYPPYSLEGKTGTEKQKEYAKDLVECFCLTVTNNGTPGYFDQGENKPVFYVSEEDANDMVAAYRFMEKVVESKKTYGEVISLLRYYRPFDLVEKIRCEARTSKLSGPDYINYMLELYEQKLEQEQYKEK